MKKTALFLTVILIFTSFSMTAFSANAEEPNESETPEQVSDGYSLPSSYSSRDLGYTTSVKTQYGDLCWAYASVASLESLLLKNGIFEGDLTIDDLDAWGSYLENSEGWQRNTKQAGYTYIPIGYYTSWNGPLTENQTKPKYGATSVRFFGKNDMDAIKTAIMEYGAVTSNLNWQSTAMSKDQNSYCLTDKINVMSGHTVSVVGWDDNYSREHFDGNYYVYNDGAWLCKNSWGNNNELGGYVWISYEDFYLFNDDFFPPNYCVTSLREIGENDHLYQNEVFGATYDFDYVDSDLITYMNVFDFSQDGNVIDEVVFETSSVGAKYSVYYVPLESDGTPVNYKSRWTKLSEGTVDYRGYILSEIDDFTVSKTRAAIAVELDTEQLNSEREIRIDNVLGVDEWLRNRDTGHMMFLRTSEEKTSYIRYNGQTQDLKEFYISQNDEIGGTFVIKAITNGDAATDILGDVNLDGEVNINDVTLIQLYLAGLKKDLSGDMLTNADFNSDGVLNINDATAIQIKLTEK